MTTMSITPKGLYIFDVALPGGKIGPFSVEKTAADLDQARCAANAGDHRSFVLSDVPSAAPKVA